MSLQTWCCQGPHKPSSCTTFSLNSHCSRATTGKKKKKSFVFMHAGSLRFCLTLCDPVDCGLPGFSVRERVLQVRILEHIGQDWLPYLFRALYFLLPWPPTPLSTWCCQNPCDPSSCTTSTPGHHKANSRPSGEPQELDDSGQPTCKGGNKTTIGT